MTETDRVRPLLAATSGVMSSECPWMVRRVLVGVALAAVLFVASVWAGLQRASSTVALGMLAAVTATGLIPVSENAVNIVGTVAYCTVYPIALGLVVGSMQPTRTVASAVTPLIPFALTLFWVSAPVPPSVFGWRDGTPDDYVRPMVRLYSPLPVGVAVAVVVVVGCLVAIRHHERARHDRVSDSSGP